MRDIDITWADANQRELVRALASVKTSLAQFAGEDSAGKAGAELAAPDQPSSATTLEKLTQTFGLSSFEQSILLLCAGIELDSSFAPLCAQVHKDAARNYPTFSLALGVF